MRIHRKTVVLVSVSIGLGLALGGVVLQHAEGSQAADLAPAGPATARQSMDSLRDPRVAADKLPASASSLVLTSRPADVDEALFEGRWQMEGSKRLLSFDDGEVEIYAVPTEKGKVCYVTLLGGLGGGGCVHSFSSLTPFSVSAYDPDAVNAGTPVIVSGLVPDDVVAVDVVVAGSHRAAFLQSNAYLYRFGDTTEFPEAVVAHYGNGQMEEVRLPDPRPGMLSVGK